MDNMVYISKDSLDAVIAYIENSPTGDYTYGYVASILKSLQTSATNKTLVRKPEPAGST